MDNIIIRNYIQEDYPEIVKLWKETELWGTERCDTQEIIEKCIIHGGKFLVMMDAQTNLLIGSSWMTFDGRRLFLHHFCIKPAYRYRGLGTQLANASLKYIQTSGHQVKLEVHKENYIAKHLYEKLGFFAFTDFDIYMIRDVEGILP